jgi:prepilin-type N-terminal cleavage/methylation domain-containing protein
MTARRTARGFTLLEIAVSLAILGVGMVACIQAFGGGLRLQDRTSRQDRAVELAREAMDRLIEDPNTRSGSEERDRYRVAWSTRKADQDDGIQQDDGLDGVVMRYLQVDVTWGDGAGAKTYTVRTLQPVMEEE